MRSQVAATSANGSALFTLTSSMATVAIACDLAVGRIDRPHQNAK